LLRNFQTQILHKIAISSGFSGPVDEVESLAQVIIPMGLTSNDSKTLRNVALTLSKALTY
jgi:hypothetical protein